MTPFVVGNDSGIVAKLEEFIGDYGSIPQLHYALPIALWALATYCYEKFDGFGYLCFTSTAPGFGKTGMLEVLECICCRAKLKVKVTLAGMCSLIEKCKPTILIDQAERLSRNEQDDLMSCILARYRSGILVTIQRNGEALDRPIYCPKAFALLGDMLAGARDRSIIIEMRPARTRKRWFRSEALERGVALQKRCGQLMVECGDAIDDAFANFDGLSFLLEREEEIVAERCQRVLRFGHAQRVQGRDVEIGCGEPSAAGNVGKADRVWLSCWTNRQECAKNRLPRAGPIWQEVRCPKW